jgi:hypothetical protein
VLLAQLRLSGEGHVVTELAVEDVGAKQIRKLQVAGLLGFFKGSDGHFNGSLSVGWWGMPCRG